MQFNVPDMSCGHCTSAIEKAVKSADSRATVLCDIPSHRVTITSSLDEGQLGAVLKDAGYDSTPVAA